MGGWKAIAAMLTTLAAILLPAVSAQAAPDYGDAALNWAESHAAGHWYAYGAAGPSYYDCSGLVMAAFAHEGVWLPHNTVAMLGSGKLVRVSYPRRGDLAFFGTGHVELVTKWWHTTFGAHHSGMRIGWLKYNGYWYPTSFWRVI